MRWWEIQLQETYQKHSSFFRWLWIQQFSFDHLHITNKLDVSLLNRFIFVEAWRRSKLTHFFFFAFVLFRYREQIICFACLKYCMRSWQLATKCVRLTVSTDSAAKCAAIWYSMDADSVVMLSLDKMNFPYKIKLHHFRA